MQLTRCSCMCRAAPAGTDRLAGSKHFLAGKHRLSQLTGLSNPHRRPRSQQLCVRSMQRGLPASQERVSAPTPPPKSGTPNRSLTAAQPRGVTTFRASKRSRDAAVANNIAPVTVRARAAWRMLGRGRRSPSLDRESIEAAARTASRSASVTPATPVTGRPGSRGAATAAAAAAATGAALAPIPRLLLRADGLHKPIGLVLASAHVLFTACALTGVPTGPAWLPALAGGALGTLYAGLNRAGMRRFWRAPAAPLTVVVTGGSQGIGKALAREFLQAGDSVVVTSRTAAGARAAAADLRGMAGPGARVHGVVCDVASPGSVARLASTAGDLLGHVDVWINNAGCSGSFQYLVDARPEQLAAVVSTNLLGSLLATRAACRLMELQPGGGHVFNMDGAGADGQPTPQYAAYGATKAGIAHLMGSLQAELSERGSPVMVHTLSPGMVLTDLLLAGATDTNKKIFNILCEHPETVAAYLVPRVRTVVARGGAGRYIRYLTTPRALLRFLAAPLNANRYFDSGGNRVYGCETERISGQRQRRTERLAVRAARRSRTLGFAYSLSMAASFLIIVTSSAGLPTV